MLVPTQGKDTTIPLYEFTCPCGQTHQAIRPIGTTEIDCPEGCEGATASLCWTKAPTVIIRPDGWNLRPGEPGYSNLPKTDREIHQWQR